MMSEKSDFAHPWEAFLPQSADDKEMFNAIKALYSQIDVHVENYYGTKVHPGDDQHSLMGHLSSVDSGKLPGTLETLMGESGRPLPLIKHSFSWFILSKLSPSANPEQTLLPVEFGRLPPKPADTKSRTGEEKGRSTSDHGSKLYANNNAATSEAYNYWRVLTSYLMHPSISSTAHNNRSAILSTAAHLSTAFAPWSKNERGAQEHLESVLKAASETGLLIMSQPSRFTFAWDVLRPNEQGSVVVYPAFEKTSDEQGRGLSRNQVLVEPTVEKI